MTTTAEYNNDLSSADAFALPTKSVFSLEKVNNTSLSLLSSNADTHYSLGMSYMLLLSDSDEDEENIVMKKEWMFKSKLHLVACASLYSCMIDRICDVDKNENLDDIGHVEIDGYCVGWKNFQQEGYLKSAMKSGVEATTERMLLKVIQILCERVKNIHSPNVHNDPIVKDMKDILSEIQETVASPDDSMRLLLSLSRMKAKVAVQTEKRIKKESLEARKAKYRGHRAKIPGATFKSQVPSKNPKPTKTPAKRQRANSLSPPSSPQEKAIAKTNVKNVLTPLQIPMSREQEQNILSPAAFSKTQTIKFTPQSKDLPLKNSASSTETMQNKNISTPSSNKIPSSNLNLWEIGTPIFQGVIGGEESLKVLKDSQKDLRSPYPSLKIEKKFNFSPKPVDKQEDNASSMLWKNAPSSLKKKVQPVPPSKRPKNSVRRKPIVGNVHANYDSKRHNRYRPMMKSSKKDIEVPHAKVITPVKSIWNLPLKPLTTSIPPPLKNFKPKSVIKKKSAGQNVHANYDSKRHNRYRPMMKSTTRKSDSPVSSVKTFRHASKASFSVTRL